MGRPRKYQSQAEKQRAYRQNKSRQFRNAEALLNPRDRIEITRPPLRWLGGKWRVAQWIIDHFPPHETYVEPYGGAANVLLQKTPSEIEIYNDLNSDIVTFFDVLRGAPEKLIRAIQLTPFSREVQLRSWQPSEDPLERALRLYVRCYQSFQPGADGRNSGWRLQKSNRRGKTVVSDWTETDHLWAVAQRLKMVQIEHAEALSVIQHTDGPDVLFYVDPPYVLETRADSHTPLFRHEMNDSDHRDLAAVLRQIQGMAVVSGYPCPLYDVLYQGWSFVEKTASTNAGGSGLERLWLSPHAVDVAKLPLFSLG